MLDARGPLDPTGQAQRLFAAALGFREAAACRSGAGALDEELGGRQAVTEVACLVEGAGEVLLGERFTTYVTGHGDLPTAEEATRYGAALDAVEEAAVVAVDDGEGSRAIHAVVVTGAGNAVDERTLVDGLRGTLPAYALPTGFTFLGALPRTPTGKVDRRALREQMA